MATYPQTFGNFSAYRSNPAANNALQQPMAQLPQTQQPYTIPQNGGVGSNPYLGAQANAITQQANQNLQYNVLPQVNSGAMAAGGYGGSRHGIAQGLAIGQNQQGIANALAGMYGQAYQNDQNLASQWGIAGMNADTARYGADASRMASMYGSDSSRMASMYGADQSSAASRYASDNSLEATRLNNATTAAGQQLNYQLGLGQNDIARMNADTNALNVGNQYQLGLGGLANSRYATDASTGLGYAGLQNQSGIANLQNQTQRYLGDQSYGVGMANAATNALNASNQYQLGLGQLGNTAYANQTARDLGYGNLGLGYEQAANQRYATDASTGLGYYNAGNQYQLGLGSLANQQQQTANTYNLGLGDMMSRYALGMGGLDNQRYIADQNFYTSQRGQDLGQMQLGANLFGSGINGSLGLGQGVYDTGSAYQSAPYDWLTQYANAMSPFTGLNSSQQITGPNSTAANAMGGALLGNRVAGLFGGSSYTPSQIASANAWNVPTSIAAPDSFAQYLVP